jgi:preprotein translocase subunit SecE
MEDNALVAKPKQWLAVTKEFVTDTRAEMKKVTWPSRNEVVGTTVVVLVATIVFALYLWGVDYIFYQGINYLFTRFGAGT